MQVCLRHFNVTLLENYAAILIFSGLKNITHVLVKCYSIFIVLIFIFYNYILLVQTNTTVLDNCQSTVCNCSLSFIVFREEQTLQIRLVKRLF